MTDAVTIVLEGPPQGKARPRFRTVTTKTGVTFASAYTPAKTRAYEAALSWAAKAAMRARSPLEGPLAVCVVARMPVPSSWSNKKRDAALAGVVRPTGRPDLDNLVKAPLDAFNGIVWRDDAQVVECSVSKFYSETPSLSVVVSPL